MTKNKVIITIITIFCFLFSALIPTKAKASVWNVNSLISQEDSTDEEKISPIKIGDRAPYSGILFSTSAAAKIAVEKENEEAKCNIKVEKEVSLIEAKYTLLLNNEKASRESAQNSLKEIRKLKDEQILFMAKQLEKTQPKRDLTPLWISVGLVSGILVMLASGLALKQVAK